MVASDGLWDVVNDNVSLKSVYKFIGDLWIFKIQRICWWGDKVSIENGSEEGEQG